MLVEKLPPQIQVKLNIFMNNKIGILIINYIFDALTLTDRQCEFGQRTGSKSLIPVIVPIYLNPNTLV